MKATLKIKPGCEAGSLYCGDCVFSNSRHGCSPFNNIGLEYVIWYDNDNRCQGDKKRCQQCLESEVKDEN